MGPQSLRAASVYRNLLKSLRKHVGREDYKKHFRDFITEEFQKNSELSDPSSVQNKLRLAHDYTFLLNSVHHQKELLFSYNIAVDRSDEMTRILGKSAASVGLQLPESFPCRFLKRRREQKYNVLFGRTNWQEKDAHCSVIHKSRASMLDVFYPIYSDDQREQTEGRWGGKRREKRKRYQSAIGCQFTYGVDDLNLVTVTAKRLVAKLCLNDEVDALMGNSTRETIIMAGN
ncbi:hypothetical protein Ancab_019929 [Ancistrocladus abbreviatus]